MIKNLRIAAKIYLIVLFVLLVVVPVAALGYNYYQQRQYVEVSVPVLKSKILANKVATFVTIGNRVELTFTNTHSKYFAMAQSVEQVEKLRNFTLFTPQGKPRTINNIESKLPFTRYFFGYYTKLMVLFLLSTMPFIWGMALADLLKSQFTIRHNKQIWILGIILVPLIGPFCYAFMADKQKSRLRLV